MDRAEYSTQRITELTERLGPIDHVISGEPFCIYATGSYGRLEAWEGSDIDLFFLYRPAEPNDSLPVLKFIRVTACLIEATEAMGFPPFSADGRFLEVQDVAHMERVLGSPEDDSLNAFTARMLLLLESRSVYGEALYGEILEQVVNFYYRDLAGHEESFLPTFLLNDILRFWRTLTLNYEHDRFEISQLSEDAQPEARAKSALKNYKLKLSRLATCFSMVAHLASEGPPVLPERVLEVCRRTPLKRFEDLRGQSGSADASIDKVAETYSNFLDRVQRQRDDLLTDFRDEDTRRALLADAATFGTEIYGLLTELVPPDRMRSLVI